MFEFYRTRSDLPFPQSISTALRAFRNNQIPVDPVIFRAGSADTMFQQPLNVALLKEIFAKSGLDTEINKKIARILFSYVGNEDQEISDFAAQYLSKLEERYLKAIRLQEEDEPETVEQKLKLAHLYFDFSAIEQFNPTLQRFYLNKSDAVVRNLLDSTPEALYLKARIALTLGRIEETESIMNSSPYPKSEEGLLILAEAAFLRRDITVVYRLVEEIAGMSGAERSAETTDFINQWRRYE